MVVPQWLNKYISANEVQKLEHQVADIESQCDVEIVPVVVRSSSEYAQTRITLALISIIIFLEAYNLLNIQWSWDGKLNAIIFAATFAVVTFGLVPLLAKNGWVQMVLTHRFVEAEQCWKRAEVEFYSGRVSKTKKDNGILIYISMLEHRVIVRCDKSINDKIDGSLWAEVVKQIISGTRRKKMADGLSEALNTMRGLLITHFPLRDSKENEIPNTFIIKE